MHLVCADGVQLASTLFRPEAPTEGEAPRYLLIHSATAIKRGFYTPFAQHATQLGFHVITYDCRGIGDSRTLHPRQDPARKRDWGRLDQEAALQHVAQLAQGDWSRITVLGHSSGGNLCGLAPSFAKVQRMLIVASGTADWRLYPRHQWPRILSAWYGLVPAVLALVGYMPARLGVGHDLPKGVAQDWRNWSVRKGYLFTDPSLDISGYAAFRGQLFALGFSDDLNFAPPATMADLLRHFPNAQVQRQTINPKKTYQRSVGHFGFFSSKNADLWPLLHSALGVQAAGTSGK